MTHPANPAGPLCVVNLIIGAQCSQPREQLTKYFLNTLASSKGEETSVSILRNKKLIFGCEHFVPRFGPTRSKTNIRQVESSVSDKPEGSEQTYNIMITTKTTLDNTSNCYLIQHPISSYSHNQSEWWGRFVPNRYLSHSNP